MAYELLHSLSMQGGLNPSAPPLSPNSQASLAASTWNSIISGDGFVRGFSGFTSQGANTGSRKMLPFGKTWGGIRDVGAVVASGSFIEDIGRSRWGIGSGQPMIEGADVSGFTLSTNLKVSIASGGVFAAPVQAGLNQPSAPEIGIIQATGDVSNSISCKIERRRPSTGAKSVASPTSAVIRPLNNRVRVTFPTASTGQTHWRVYFTFQGFGGVGIHYLWVYDALAANPADIPESVVAASTVDGIARSLEFNYKDGDLLPVEASYDDYPPPPATHLIRLQNVMCLAGCYSDAASPTSTNTGTAIAVSKINNYESYVPSHLLFLPEQVTDTLARPVDDFGYVACENSIHAIQYVGYRGDELPPCTITTILPDIGISYPHNWTHFRGQLVLYTAEGQLLMMDEGGEFDTDFAAPIVKIIKNWAPANTIVGYDPKNDLLIIANGKRILCYSLSSRAWRQIWLPDFGVTGNVLSCTTSKRRLYISVDNAGSVTAYTFDTNTLPAPLSFAANYTNAPTGNAAVKDLLEIAASCETSENTFFALCVSKDMATSALREVYGTSGNGYINTNTDAFEAAMLGKKVIIFADNIGGTGVHYLIARIASFAGSNANLADLQGTPIVLPVTFSNTLMFIGDYIAVRTINAQKRHFPNFFPNLPECRSYQISCFFKGSAQSGNVLGIEIFGNVYSSSRAK